MKQSAERARIESSLSENLPANGGDPQKRRAAVVPVDEDQVMLWLSEADTDGDIAEA